MRGEMPLKACTTREAAREKGRRGRGRAWKKTRRVRKGERGCEDKTKRSSAETTNGARSSHDRPRKRGREKEKESLQLASGSTGGEKSLRASPTAAPTFLISLPSRPGTVTPSLNFSRSRSFSLFLSLSFSLSFFLTLSFCLSFPACVWLNIALLF